MKALLYPKPFSSHTTLRGVLDRLYIEYHNDKEDEYDFIIACDPRETYPNHSTDSFLIENMKNGIYVLNFNLNDISKRNVDAVFSEIFGYSLIVDKKNIESLNKSMVVKSDLNARHDGRIIEPPFEESDIDSIGEDSLLFLEINNCDGNFCIDYRMCIFDYYPGFTGRSEKKKEFRFGHLSTSAVRFNIFLDLSKCFSSDEISNIYKFCKKIGLEYGNLDILRDFDTGLLYIIDVTPTPGGYSNFYGDISKAFESVENIEDVVYLRSLLDIHYEDRFWDLIERNIKKSKEKDSEDLIG